MSEKKEYIERGATLKRVAMVKKYYGNDGEFTWIEAVSHHDICAIPAADVEPVVRCPECVNGQRVNNVWTRCAKDGTRRLDSFYCAHGKERER